MFFSYGSSEPGYEYLEPLLEKESTTLTVPLEKTRDIQDKLCYIYTRYGGEKDAGCNWILYFYFVLVLEIWM
jgi:hypothetical protein